MVSGKCYRYRELLSDGVGNQGASGASSTAKVDTSAPAAPSLSYGSSRTLRSRAIRSTTGRAPAAASSRSLRARTTCSPASPPTASRPHASGWSVSGSGASRTYSHSGSPSDPAEPLDVTAVNGAGLSSAASGFTVTPDASAPSGISASITGGYYTTASVAVTLDDGSDTGSGVDAASGVVERDEAPLDNGDGSCDAFPGSWATVTLSGGNDTSVVSGTCYRYRYLLSDRVGNQATSGASATAKVDTSAASAPSLSYGSLSNAILNLGVVYYLPGAASGQFAVTARLERRAVRHCLVRLPRRRLRLERLRLGATHAPTATPARPADPTEPNDVTAMNGAGLASGATSFTVTPDGTPPATSIQCDGGSCAGGWYTADVSVALSAVRRRLGPRRDSLHDRRLRPQPRQRNRVRVGLHDLQRDHDSLPRLRPARQRRGRRPASDPDRPERADHLSLGGQRLRFGPLERVGHGLLPPGRFRLLRPDGNGHGRSVGRAEGELPERDRLRRRRRRHHGSVQQGLQLHRLPGRARLADDHRLQQRQRQLDGFCCDHRRLQRAYRELGNHCRAATTRRLRSQSR